MNHKLVIFTPPNNLHSSAIHENILHTICATFIICATYSHSPTKNTKFYSPFFSFLWNYPGFSQWQQFWQLGLTFGSFKWIMYGRTERAFFLVYTFCVTADVSLSSGYIVFIVLTHWSFRHHVIFPIWFPKKIYHLTMSLKRAPTDPCSTGLFNSCTFHRRRLS